MMMMMTMIMIMMIVMIMMMCIAFLLIRCEPSKLAGTRQALLFFVSSMVGKGRTFVFVTLPLLLFPRTTPPCRHGPPPRPTCCTIWTLSFGKRRQSDDTTGPGLGWFHPFRDFLRRKDCNGCTALELAQKVLTRGGDNAYPRIKRRPYQEWTDRCQQISLFLPLIDDNERFRSLGALLVRIETTPSALCLLTC